MQELWFLHSAHRLMLIDICKKLHEISLNSFQVSYSADTIKTQFCD